MNESTVLPSWVCSSFCLLSPTYLLLSYHTKFLPGGFPFNMKSIWHWRFWLKHFCFVKRQIGVIGIIQYLAENIICNVIQSAVTTSRSSLSASPLCQKQRFKDDLSLLKIFWDIHIFMQTKYLWLLSKGKTLRQNKQWACAGGKAACWELEPSLLQELRWNTSPDFNQRWVRTALQAVLPALEPHRKASPGNSRLSVLCPPVYLLIPSPPQKHSRPWPGPNKDVRQGAKHSLMGRKPTFITQRSP